MRMPLAVIAVLGLCCIRAPVFAQDNTVRPPTKIVLLITEQNISGLTHAWWLNEIDLSTVESTLAQQLIEAGYEIVEPAQLQSLLKDSPAFRMLSLKNCRVREMGDLAKAQYAVAGRAVASAGARLPQSEMRSYYANVTARVIRVLDGKVAAYLNAEGKSVHTDGVTGGREALSDAGKNLAGRVMEVLKKEGVR